MGRVIGMTGACSIIAGACVLGCQGYVWFYWGYWTAISISDFATWVGVPIPYSDSDDVERIILWCLNTPLAFDIMVLPLVIVVLAFLVGAMIGEAFLGFLGR